jgi:hypothetical protein
VGLSVGEFLFPLGEGKGGVLSSSVLASRRYAMLKLGRIGLYAFVFCAACAWTLNAQETKKEETPKKKVLNTRSKGTRTHPSEANENSGVIVSVDTEKNTLTVKGDDNKEHTLAVSEQTKIMGPRGRAVPNLKDKHIHQGLDVTWYADKDGKLRSLVLGIDRPKIRVPVDGKEKEETKEKPKEKTKDKDK